MRTLRTALTAAALCLLAGGYAASQVAFFTGRAGEYAAAVDVPVVKWASLAILVSAVVMTLLRDGGPEGESE